MGRAVRVRYVGATRAISPNGCKLAVPANDGAIHLIDLRHFSLGRTVGLKPRKTYRDTEVEIAAWPDLHHLIVYTQGDSAHDLAPSHLVVIDPTRGRVLRTIPLHGSVFATGVTSGGAAELLVSPVHAIGDARLITATPNGPLGSIALRKIPIGYLDSGVGGPTSQGRSPALVVHRDTAWVIGTHSLVAKVAVGSQRVTYRHIHELMASNATKAKPFVPGSIGIFHGIDRGAQWIGHGEAVVTGQAQLPVDHKHKLQDVPASAQVVDLRRGRVLRTFRNVPYLNHHDGMFFGSPASRNDFDPPRRLFGYNAAGHRRYVAHGGTRDAWEFVAGRLVRGRLDGSHAVELDPHTGKQIRDLGKPAIWPYDVTVVHPGAVTGSPYE